MARQLITGRQVALGADTSNVTSPPWLVVDWRQMSISVETGSAFASRITVQGTNLDGFKSTLSSAGGFGNSTVPVGNWSHVTIITGQGLFTIDPGFRWICVIRPTQGSGQTASNITVTLVGRT